MRIIHIMFVSACVAMLSPGCIGDDLTPDRPYVIMNGSLKRVENVETRAVISPRPGSNGLPNNQLSVGIMTVNYTTADPATDQPDSEAWMSASVNLSHGCFGGPGIMNPGQRPTNGEINYTTEDGRAIRRLFYDESGEHYFTRVCYPFFGSSETRNPVASLNQTPFGAEVVISELNGSQDVMVSNLAWGNIHSPQMQTDAADGVVVMSHLFSLFRVKVRAENQKAVEQFGTIEDVVLKAQPSSVGINMINLNLSLSRERTDYRMVRNVILPPGPLPSVDVGGYRDAGYVMAPPAVEFMFEVLTSGHGWVQGYVDTSGSATGMSLAGHSYEVVLTFMESGEVEIVASDPTQYWFDWVFD